MIGPVLLRSGLTVRNVISYFAQGGNTKTTTVKEFPYLDMMLMIPYAQKLISLAVYEESAQVVTQYNDQQRKKNKKSIAAGSASSGDGEESSSSSSIDQMYDSLFGAQQQTHQQDQIQHSRTVSELRMQVLHEKIRPALLPNELWSDVMKWRFNARVLKWARTEFLISKYGPDVKEALDAYPQIRSSPQLSKHPTQRMLMNIARGRPINLKSKADQNTTTTTNSRKSNNKNKNNRKRKSTSMVPSTETLMKAFRMRSWAKDKHSQRYVLLSVC